MKVVSITSHKAFKFYRPITFVDKWNQGIEKRQAIADQKSMEAFCGYGMVAKNMYYDKLDGSEGI